MKKNTYLAHQLKSDKLEITGKGRAKAWENAHKLSNFISPWDPVTVLKIEFKALWAVENLYFMFKVHDPLIYIDTTNDSKESIGNSDRVELFFRSNSDMDPYYCLEIDPSPRVMDFKAYPGQKFDFNWNWPKEGLVVKSDIQKKHFVVEGSISMDSLKKFNLIHDNKIEVGIFRAKYNRVEGKQYKPTWISWVKPNSETPDFHIPSSFGVLELIG